MIRCPSCGQAIAVPVPDGNTADHTADARLIEKVTDVRAACRRLGILESGDGWIALSGAARINARRSKSFRNAIYRDENIETRKRRGRLEMRVVDAAKLLLPDDAESA